MKYLKLNESFRPLLGEEYNTTKYPESGLYKIASGYIFIDKISNLVFGISSNNLEFEEVSPKDNLQEDFILKLIAVTSSPVLAAQLIKGN